MSPDVMVVHHRDDHMNDPIMLFLVLSSRQYIFSGNG